MYAKFEYCEPGLCRVGAASCEVTPSDSQFLFGYPDAARMSTGVHDPLLASAIFLDDGQRQAMFISVDVIALSKAQVTTVRQRIAEATTVPADHIMVSATHTHSGPVTVNMLSNSADPAVPAADPEYLGLLREGIARAAIEAFKNAEEAEIGLVEAVVAGVGTNRHVTSGPAMPQVPVLVVRSPITGKTLCLMWVCAMHPTVLHEDSTLISGDFPAAARRFVQSNYLSESCIILHHMGAAGNQSPRHVVREHSFSEAERIGRILAEAIVSALQGEITYVADWKLWLDSVAIDLPLRALPSPQQAEYLVREKQQRLDDLRSNFAQVSAVRTAECDLFGARETLVLARANASGRVAMAARSCLPAEIQLIGLGKWLFVGWPGEVFVEHAIELQRHYSNSYVITLANGDLQGYLVTAEAVGNNTYEASNALFASPVSPQLLLKETLALLKKREDMLQN